MFTIALYYYYYYYYHHYYNYSLRCITFHQRSLQPVLQCSQSPDYLVTMKISSRYQLQIK